MSKETSPSRQVAIKTFTVGFQILKDAGGSLPRKTDCVNGCERVKNINFVNRNEEAK